MEENTQSYGHILSGVLIVYKEVTILQFNASLGSLVFQGTCLTHGVGQFSHLF